MFELPPPRIQTQLTQNTQNKTSSTLSWFLGWQPNPNKKIYSCIPPGPQKQLDTTAAQDTYIKYVGMQTKMLPPNWRKPAVWLWILADLQQKNMSLKSDPHCVEHLRLIAYSIQPLNQNWKRYFFKKWNWKRNLDHSVQTPCRQILKRR